MKKIFCFACTLLLFACGGGDDAGGGGSQTGGSEYLNVSNVDIPGGNTTATLNIQASNNCEWVISWAESWIRSISPTTGRGTQNVTITLTVNPSSTAARTAIVTVKNTSGTITRNITITQAANAEQLTIIPKDLINFSADGGRQEVTITSNTHWEITGKPNWLTISETEGTGNGNVIISVGTNPHTETRETVLTFKGNQITIELKVVQSAASYYVNLTLPQVFEITQNSAMVSFTYDSNHTVTAYGICYATTIDPTIESSPNVMQTGTTYQGNPTLQLTNLEADTKYYVRAFARIKDFTEVSYSECIYFTSLGNIPNADDNKTPNPDI